MKGLVRKVTKLIFWLKNRKNYKEGKRLNLSNILNYADAQVNQWKSTSSFMKLDKYKEEQSIWRLEQIKDKSPECLKDGICVMCGCDVVEETFGWKGCDYGCYPNRLSKELWEKFKTNNKIKQIC